jgi:hypothetical protein
VEKETRWNSGAPMTDEERQKLCEDLRQIYRYIDNDEINGIIWRATDEIERLTALAQSNVELVACAIANRSNELGLDLDGEAALHGICQEELERARQPRPDASAGLIEAAEMASVFKGNADPNAVRCGTRGLCTRM